ncbi:MAG: exodeoxyribonuclease VII small subunit [Geodermatophilaceae bacterium]|nr:exodeoxyribonuclease VII small subunit [Geodermatophilaceae bacterium]
MAGVSDPSTGDNDPSAGGGDPSVGGGDPSYEQARDELAAIVGVLESGGQTLEQALTLWERAEVLAAICQSWLDNARRRLETARGTTQADAGGGTGDS